ncbi:hypothetical protein CMO96_01470 [Candidatus Woesebacteria bacterium]|nr:hypothetical protein [Candidatus Woesebacteria bacterium]|tara:strand:+ start:283 stop:810 length:528 start_codon:yes stop_codon:yes gene_type:complete
MEKEIFNGKIVRLVTEAREVNGKTVDFEKVYLAGSVHVLPVTTDGKLRLVRERRWDRDNEVRDKVLAGIVEGDEDSELRAREELAEELGLRAGSLELFWKDEQRGTLNDTRYYFIARDLEEGEASPEETEDIVGHKDITLDELYDMAVSTKTFSAGTVAAISRLKAMVDSGSMKL